MWTREILGTDLYHIIHWFIVYSILGWTVESIYMSFCNKRLTNRGFAKGPFCPIYGVGALTVYFLLRPLMPNYFLLYFCGAIMATSIEFVTAKIMLSIFGSVWWDYHDKPFNYKGILCLESTIAWGFYTVLMFWVLQDFVMKIVDSYDYRFGIMIGRTILIVYLLDFMYQIYKIKKEGKDIRAFLA